MTTKKEITEEFARLQKKYNEMVERYEQDIALAEMRRVKDQNDFTKEITRLSILLRATNA